MICNSCFSFISTLKHVVNYCTPTHSARITDVTDVLIHSEVIEAARFLSQLQLFHCTSIIKNFLVCFRFVVFDQRTGTPLKFPMMTCGYDHLNREIVMLLTNNEDDLCGRGEQQQFNLRATSLCRSSNNFIYTMNVSVFYLFTAQYFPSFFRTSGHSEGLHSGLHTENLASHVPPRGKSPDARQKVPWVIPVAACTLP